MGLGQYASAVLCFRLTLPGDIVTSGRGGGGGGIFLFIRRHFRTLKALNAIDVHYCCRVNSTALFVCRRRAENEPNCAAYIVTVIAITADGLTSFGVSGIVRGATITYGAHSGWLGRRPLSSGLFYSPRELISEILVPKRIEADSDPVEFVAKAEGTASRCGAKIPRNPMKTAGRREHRSSDRIAFTGVLVRGQINRPRKLIEMGSRLIENGIKTSFEPITTNRTRTWRKDGKARYADEWQWRNTGPETRHDRPNENPTLRPSPPAFYAAPTRRVFKRISGQDVQQDIENPQTLVRPPCIVSGRLLAAARGESSPADGFRGRGTVGDNNYYWCAPSSLPVECLSTYRFRIARVVSGEKPTRPPTRIRTLAHTLARTQKVHTTSGVWRDEKKNKNQRVVSSRNADGSSPLP